MLFLSTLGVDACTAHAHKHAHARTCTTQGHPHRTHTGTQTHRHTRACRHIAEQNNRQTKTISTITINGPSKSHTDAHTRRQTYGISRLRQLPCLSRRSVPNTPFLQLVSVPFPQRRRWQGDFYFGRPPMGRRGQRLNAPQILRRGSTSRWQ